MPNALLTPSMSAFSGTTSEENVSDVYTSVEEEADGEEDEQESSSDEEQLPHESWRTLEPISICATCNVPCPHNRLLWEVCLPYRCADCGEVSRGKRGKAHWPLLLEEHWPLLGIHEQQHSSIASSSHQPSVHLPEQLIHAPIEISTLQKPIWVNPSPQTPPEPLAIIRYFYNCQPVSPAKAVSLNLIKDIPSLHHEYHKLFSNELSALPTPYKLRGLELSSIWKAADPIQRTRKINWRPREAAVRPSYVFAGNEYRDWHANVKWKAERRMRAGRVGVFVYLCFRSATMKGRRLVLHDPQEKEKPEGWIGLEVDWFREHERLEFVEGA